MDHKQLSVDFFEALFEHYRWKGRYIKYQLLLFIITISYIDCIVFILTSLIISDSAWKMELYFSSGHVCGHHVTDS